MKVLMLREVNLFAHGYKDYGKLYGMKREQDTLFIQV